ncbi:hypothetical protein TeGR_g8967, partial [Tetraparma gracilis]
PPPPPPPLTQVDPTEFQEPSESKSSKAGLTSKDLMGDVSMDGSVSPDTAKGGLVSWYRNRAQQKEEDQQRKMEKWQEVMQKQQEEAAKQEAA